MVVKSPQIQIIVYYGWMFATSSFSMMHFQTAICKTLCKQEDYLLIQIQRYIRQNDINLSMNQSNIKDINNDESRCEKQTNIFASSLYYSDVSIINKALFSMIKAGNHFADDDYRETVPGGNGTWRTSHVLAYLLSWGLYAVSFDSKISERLEKECGSSLKW
uniref:Uncharacterized protein n=1 Tax=Onchocerca volvulus TaxID=6282 RepID=A0A8R1TRE5_ONCVO